MADADEIAKVAQNQIAQAMSKAMENVGDSTAEQRPPYVEPMQDPYGKAIKYLENHNILQLFQQLTASIVYTKPDRPLEYMMSEVERMKKEKEAEDRSTTASSSANPLN